MAVLEIPFKGIIHHTMMLCGGTGQPKAVPAYEISLQPGAVQLPAMQDRQVQLQYPLISFAKANVTKEKSCQRFESQGIRDVVTPLTALT